MTGNRTTLRVSCIAEEHSSLRQAVRSSSATEHDMQREAQPEEPAVPVQFRRSSAEQKKRKKQKTKKKTKKKRKTVQRKKRIVQKMMMHHHDSLTEELTARQ